MNFTKEAQALEETIIARRRDLHRYPEAAWTEYRTASLVAQTLTKLGFDVACGAAVVAVHAMMGVPSAEELKKHEERAVA